MPRAILKLDGSHMVLFSRQTFIYFLVAIVFAAILFQLSPILSPFLIAAFLAYIGDPVVDWFEARKIKRTVGVSIVFVVMLLLVTLIVIILAPLIESQIRSLIAKTPVLIKSINQQLLPLLEDTFAVQLPSLNANTLSQAAKQHWDQVGGVLGVIVAFLGDSTQFAIAIATSATIVPVVAFYLLRDWDIMVARIHELIPRKFEPAIARFARESDAVLAEFLRGQLALMVSQAVYFCIALALIGLDTALLVGLTAGTVSFVPYLGVIIGMGAGVLAAYMQFQEWLPVLMVIAVFGVGQILEGVVLQPWLIGDRIGMHPVAVIFAVMAGGQLFGFVGVLIALPVAAVITVLCRHLHESYVSSDLYHDEIDIEAKLSTDE